MNKPTLTPSGFKILRMLADYWGLTLDQALERALRDACLAVLKIDASSVPYKQDPSESDGPIRRKKRKT